MKKKKTNPIVEAKLVAKRYLESGLSPLQTVKLVATDLPLDVRKDIVKRACEELKGDKL
jgi:hypothetical protein